MGRQPEACSHYRVKRMSTERFTVGQLARASGTSAETLRYYEQLGLLSAAQRTAAGYRLYGAAERDRLLFIRRCRALGFSLEEIGELLGLSGRSEESCAGIDERVAIQLQRIRQRISDLQELAQEVEQLLACCDGGVIADCRIIQSLRQPSQ